MSVINAFILGLIQGVAEFLPVSSSGHLSIAQNLFGLGLEGTDDMFFDVLLHLGTLAAVFVAYWSDIKEMVSECVDIVRDIRSGTMPEQTPPARRLILLIIIGTLPLALILPIKDAVENLSSNTYFVGFALLITGGLLYMCDQVSKGRKNERSVTAKDVLLIGVSQALATCPGISRSGMTISMGCFCGLERKFAVRFAFLLSIPAVLGANLLQIFGALGDGINWSMLPAYFVGVAVAAVSGYFSIRLLKMVAEKGKFGAFSYYCWAAGGVTLLLTILKMAGWLPWLA